MVLTSHWHQGRGACRPSDGKRSTVKYQTWSQTLDSMDYAFMMDKGNLGGFLPFLKGKTVSLDPISSHPFLLLPPWLSTLPSTGSTIHHPKCAPPLLSQSFWNQAFLRRSLETVLVKAIAHSHGAESFGLFLVPVIPDLSTASDTIDHLFSQLPERQICLLFHFGQFLLNFPTS